MGKKKNFNRVTLTCFEEPLRGFSGQWEVEEMEDKAKGPLSRNLVYILILYYIACAMHVLGTCMHFTCDRF